MSFYQCAIQEVQSRKPLAGDLVHYVCENGHHAPAWVIQDGKDTLLAFMSTADMPFEEVKLKPIYARFNAERNHGTWHWPEREQEDTGVIWDQANPGGPPLFDPANHLDYIKHLQALVKKTEAENDQWKHRSKELEKERDDLKAELESIKPKFDLVRKHYRELRELTEVLSEP